MGWGKTPAQGPEKPRSVVPWQQQQAQSLVPLQQHRQPPLFLKLQPTSLGQAQGVQMAHQQPPLHLAPTPQCWFQQC